MKCICVWDLNCDGHGAIHCHAIDCYCQCGCTDECFGCPRCEANDFDEIDDEVQP